jgi:tRNA nucleotidyltransferase (CCA-adding enzyme)
VNEPLPRALARALPTPAAELVDAVLRAAEAKDVAVYLVGGPVRDLLLGRALRDADLIVEPGEGVDAAALAAAAAPAGTRIVSHGRFGTVRLEGPDAAVDLATTRRERYARPGALPTVEPGTIEEDLGRRDFTVNALAVPLTARARRGRPALLDPGGAREDLEAGVLRIFHARSFHDDPTRALRAARLAVRLGFRLAPGTRSALRDALRDGAFGAVSGDRIRREIEKLFEDCSLSLDPVRALRLLAEWHVLGALEPGLGVPRSTAGPLRRLGRALAEPPWPVRRARPWCAGLALWLAGADATLRRRTLRRLAVRGELADRIGRFPRERERWLRELAASRGRGAIDAVLAPIADEWLLALHACAPPSGRRKISRWVVEDRSRRAPVTGNDLLGAGLSGPDVGAALARIRRAWLDGAVATREEALALAQEVRARRARSARSGRGAPSAS